MICECGTEMKLIPAGISKAGKKYNDFFACPTCKKTHNSKERVFQGTKPVLEIQKESHTQDIKAIQNACWEKACDIVIARINSGDPDALGNPVEQIDTLEKLLFAKRLHKEVK